MSNRPVAVLVGDMLDRIDRIARHTRGLDHDAFVDDEKTIDAVVRIHEYFDVDLGLVWEIATTELPMLKVSLTKIQGSTEAG